VCGPLERANLSQYNYTHTHIHIFVYTYGSVDKVSHITTDDQSVSESWFRAPSAAHDQMLITV
jgi:hypothetical protein